MAWCLIRVFQTKPWTSRWVFWQTTLFLNIKILVSLQLWKPFFPHTVKPHFMHTYLIWHLAVSDDFRPNPCIFFYSRNSTRPVNDAFLLRILLLVPILYDIMAFDFGLTQQLFCCYRCCMANDWETRQDEPAAWFECSAACPFLVQ